ncbi:Holliday junction branch migration protein RuvA [Rhodovibrio salinarum]|uniref:Holliday junction branch migration complex subunit RuvA n=1 Tax=Rhodovibrio salinarum TaxID=1087 RepID=A0A934V0D4_9PROT|nr:Holliday junction branch migration protein RuvA [Rhodovibrio salinarum]MBK1697319.1 Holliday junction branch migration protein RuvA [Rhodovibrio salinarum]
MIGKLRGMVDEVDDDHLILDVGGVGYLVHASSRTLGRLPGRSEAVALMIETVVREDAILLYGFHETAERDWFRLLNTVQGVGARHALAILSVLPPDQLAQAVAAQDKQSVARANGVGPKLAGRITAELKDKAGTIALGPTASGESPAADTGGEGPAVSNLGEVSEDAVSALTNLGYRRTEAFTAVAAASRRLGRDAGLQTLITEGLKELSQ